jgi:lysophospholipase L1-like esterase
MAGIPSPTVRKVAGVSPVGGNVPLGGPSYGMVPGNFFNWRKARASVLNGTADAKILCGGDSTTEGQGSSSMGTVPANNAYPARLASLFNAAGVPAANGLGIPLTSYGSSNDTRWTVGTGWASTTFGFAAGAAFEYTSGGGNLVFSPGGSQATNLYDVYYLTNGGLGTLYAVATGGTTVTVGTGSGGGIGKLTCTAATAATTNAVTLSGSGTVFVVGVEQYNSAVPRIRLANAGVGGSDSNQWNYNKDGTFGSASYIPVYAPNLFIYSIGINDSYGLNSGGVPTSVSTYTSNVQAMITAAKSAGSDVLLSTMPPSNSSALITYQKQYVSALIGLAQSNNVGLVDFFGRLGGAWQSSIMYDEWHPINIGYWDWAQAIFNALSGV